ncbi:pyroglutamylated RFamide peptide receptor-like [Orbicella faveolata]|uniref:pyroglutamylated RFamide peptide receptor-like n=1 Tax=Orbicella faveolata TaxID=48498 RepID=UPI0009E56499|nr:pyroglutamylated RFamide peptide receptor-like [Orbicella faveolata]
MYASFITPQYILSHTFTHPDGVTGTVLCRLLTGGNFAWVGAASSVFTLANISIERYYVVMYPLGNKGKLSERKLMVIIPGAWIFSLIVNIPVFLVVNFDNESGTCAREWPEKWMPRAYNVAWFVILAVIPLTLMVGFYSRVIYTLWFKQIDDSALTHQQKGVLRVRKRVTLAVVVVSVIFGICWITDSIVYIVSHFNTDSFGAAVYSISNTMIMFNSAVNPFVYALLNQRFREKIKSTITCKASSRARVHPTRSEPPTMELANSTSRDRSAEC